MYKKITEKRKHLTATYISTVKNENRKNVVKTRLRYTRTRNKT